MAPIPQPCNALVPEERVDVPRVHPEGAMCISLGFFWMLSLRENPSPPFYHNASLSLTIVPHTGMGPLLHVAMTVRLCVPARAVEESQAGGVFARGTHGAEALQAPTCGFCTRVALSYIGRAAHRSRRQPCTGGTITAHFRLVSSLRPWLPARTLDVTPPGQRASWPFMLDKIRIA